MSAINIDYFPYVRPSDSFLFTKLILGTNSSGCSKRTTEIRNQEIS